MGEDLSTEKLTEAGSRNHSKLLIGLALVEFIGIVILLIVLYRIQIHYSGIESASQEYITTLKNVINANDQNKTVPVDSQDESTPEEVSGFKVQIDPDEKGFFIYRKNPKFVQRFTLEDVLGKPLDGDLLHLEPIGWGNYDPKNRVVSYWIKEFWAPELVKYTIRSISETEVNITSSRIQYSDLPGFYHEATDETRSFRGISITPIVNPYTDKIAYTNRRSDFSGEYELKDLQDKIVYIRVYDIKRKNYHEVLSLDSSLIDYEVPQLIKWESDNVLIYTNPQTGEDEVYELKEE